MEMAKHIFTWYIANYSRYTVIYGGLDTLVIIVLWVFYVSYILLFCAELISAYRSRTLILLEKALTGMAKGNTKTGIDERLFRKFGKVFKSGNYIFREGDTGREMFYILNGKVRIEKQAGHVTKILAEMGRGNYFGEMAALIDSPRTASVSAATDCEIAVIDAVTFRDLLNASGTISLLILKEMSQRVKETTSKVEEMTREWIKLMSILYFLREWPVGTGRDPVAELALISGKENWEIRKIIEELSSKGMIEMEGESISGFRKERVWDILGKIPHAA